MVLSKQTNQFLGGGQTSKDYSDQMAFNLDEYIKATLDKRYKVVLKSLKEHTEAIEQMTAELLDIEVLSGKRVQDIIVENGGTFYQEEKIKESKEKKEDV